MGSSRLSGMGRAEVRAECTWFAIDRRVYIMNPLLEFEWSTPNVVITLSLFSRGMLELTRIRGKKQRVKSVGFYSDEIPDVQAGLSAALAKYPLQLLDAELPVISIDSKCGGLTFGWMPYRYYYHYGNGLMIRQHKGWRPKAVVVEQGDAHYFCTWLRDKLVLCYMEVLVIKG